MPVLSNNPVTVDGVTYDRFGVYLAISPAYTDNDVQPSLALRCERYAKDADGNVTKAEDPATAVSLVYSGITMHDEAIDEHVRTIMASVQAILNIKGM